MLVTTCPDCQTTFRISVGILEKAGGQVRCGRCAKIFDANDRLRELDGAATELTADVRPADVSPAELPEPGPDGDRGATGDAAGESGDESPSEPEAGAATDTPAATLDALDQSLRPAWLARVAAAVPEKAWIGGVGVLAVVLGLQLVHQFRHPISAVPVAGALLSGIYSAFGSPLLPRIRLNQFDLLDLTAVAESSGDNDGWLVIETRVHNRGPGSQPMPHVFVRLLDRWEDTIAGRYFSAAEYAVTGEVADRISANGTVDAQFIVVDPGPDATGFELELCARIAGGFECESDIAIR